MIIKIIGTCIVVLGIGVIKDFQPFDAQTFIGILLIIIGFKL